MENTTNNYTYRNIIERIRIGLNHPSKTNQDVFVAPKEALDAYIESYSFLVLQAIKAEETIPSTMVQSIPCIPLVDVDRDECPCAPGSGCIWKRTEFTVPIPLDGKFSSVHSPTGSIIYSQIKWNQVKYKLNSRLKADRERAYYALRGSDKGYYLYLHNSIHKENVGVDLIPQDPRQLYCLPDCEGEIDKCKTFLDEVMIGDAMFIVPAISMAIKEIARLRGISVPDILTDDSQQGDLNLN